MRRTFEELKRELRHIDEVTLLEVLEITSDDLLEAFKGRISMKRKQLQELVDDSDYDIFNNEEEDEEEEFYDDDSDYYGHEYD